MRFNLVSEEFQNCVWVISVFLSSRISKGLGVSMVHLGTAGAVDVDTVLCDTNNTSQMFPVRWIDRILLKVCW